MLVALGLLLTPFAIMFVGHFLAVILQATIELLMLPVRALMWLHSKVMRALKRI